jgi:phosphatidate cytidylyltransferase
MNEKNRNLLIRVATAAVALPTVLGITWYGGLPFGILCAWAAGMTAGELYTMSLGKAGLRWTGTWFAIAVSAGIPVAAWWSGSTTGTLLPDWLPVALGGALIVSMGTVLFNPAALDKAPQVASLYAFGWLYCGLLLGAFVGIRVRFGFGWVVLALSITWANDTLAYFAGRAFGKRKFYERVSPKKTWEGFAGGIAGSVIGAFFVKLVWLDELTPLDCILVALPGAVVGPIGDLCESMLKRGYGAKDSGTVMPGHGGLLDRIDAVLFMAPWIYLFNAYLRPIWH